MARERGREDEGSLVEHVVAVHDREREREREAKSVVDWVTG